MKAPTLRFEKSLWKKNYKIVAGADEVGRGAFAGPIVAAAVVFTPMNNPLRGKNLKFKIKNFRVRIDDSKKLTSGQREKADVWIRKNALTWGIGEIPVAVINRYGLGTAAKKAFRLAVAQAREKLGKRIDFLLIDAFFIPYVRGLPYRKKRMRRQLAIIHGDEKSFSIAAASIIAKVYRDKKMTSLSSQPKSKYKKYGWERNKGYGTEKHRKAIRKYGITRYHRKAFIETFMKRNS